MNYSDENVLVHTQSDGLLCARNGHRKHDVIRLAASIRSYSLDVMIVLSRSQRKALIR